MATTAVPAVDPVSKTPSRPALLTLAGLYQTSKSVYVSYMPEGASKTVESLAETLLSASTPYVATIQQQALPKKGGEEAVEAKGEALELNMAKLDSLLEFLCSDADTKVDQLIATSAVRLSGAKASVQAAVQTKAEAVKTAVESKAEAVKAAVETKAGAVKAAVETKAEAVKAVVHDTLGIDRVTAFQERCTDVYGDLSTAASSYFTTAQEYTPAARHVAIQYSHLIQSEVTSKGVVPTALAALTWFHNQATSTLSIIREQGLFAGAKTICTGIVATIASTLQQAKLDAITPVVDDLKLEGTQEDEPEAATSLAGDLNQQDAEPEVLAGSLHADGEEQEQAGDA